MDEIDIDTPYENTLSLEELRREVREAWDLKFAIIKALRGLPEMPPGWVLLQLGSAANFHQITLSASGCRESAAIWISPTRPNARAAPVCGSAFGKDCWRPQRRGRAQKQRSPARRSDGRARDGGWGPMAESEVTVCLTFSRRPDGALRIHSDTLPGLGLSHRNVAAVLADLGPAIQGLLQLEGRWVLEAPPAPDIPPPLW